MSNFQCPHCGMINIDCGKGGFKTPKEIKLEKKLEKIQEIAKRLIVLTDEYDNCYLKDHCQKCDEECQYNLVDDILKVIEEEQCL